MRPRAPRTLRTIEHSSVVEHHLSDHPGASGQHSEAAENLNLLLNTSRLRGHMDIAELKNSDGSRIDFNDISLESLGYHLVFGEVSTETMKDAITFVLKANKLFKQDEISLLINSVGGNCTDGFALIDMMSLSRLPIRTISAGEITSMGVLIAAAGHKGRRVMTRNCEIMAHQFSWSSEGKYHELISQTKAQQNLAYRFVEHFKRHTTMTEAQIKDVLFGTTDRWLTPQECKKFGIIDHIIDELPLGPEAAVVHAVQGERPRGSRKPKTEARKKR